MSPGIAFVLVGLALLLQGATLSGIVSLGCGVFLFLD